MRCGPRGRWERSECRIRTELVVSSTVFKTHSFFKMTDFLARLILILGGGAVVIAAVVKWAAELTAQRLSERWARDRELEIERYRVLAGQSQSVINTALSAFASGHGAAQERRLLSVETLWKWMLTLRTTAPSFVLLADILTDEEFALLYQRPELLPYSPQQVEAETIKLMEGTTSAEEHRPFCGELAWALFYVYRAVHGRLFFIFTQGLRSGTFRPWRKDPGMQQLLGSVLTEEELAGVMSGSLGRWFSTLQILEAKFLSEVQTFISGKHASDTGIREATRIIQAVQGVDRANTEKSAKARPKLGPSS